METAGQVCILLCTDHCHIYLRRKRSTIYLFSVLNNEKVLKENNIIQTFRRYNYEIISEHQEDNYINNLKERSEYLDKYLNI